MQNELKPLKISQDFQYCLDQLEYTNKNLFITGRAGTGKSILLNLFRKTTEKKFVILAPTGIAALNIKGQTIHSFFGFPPRLLNHKDIKKSRNTRLFKNLETIVIDEISMVRADIMDYIDYALKLNRGNNKPFGGVQLVVIGDLFQLPPASGHPPPVTHVDFQKNRILRSERKSTSREKPCIRPNLGIYEERRRSS